MTLENVAHAYVDCVRVEERARLEVPNMAEDLSVLRADLHALLMEALREAKIPFQDRAHAAQIAHEIAEGKIPLQA